MILFPAIDLKEGQCVRLAQGDMDRATVFNDDPAEQARAFQRVGFEYLHVVDLDGAFAGAPRNARAVEAILAALTIPVQLGGGIRDMDTIELNEAFAAVAAACSTALGLPQDKTNPNGGAIALGHPLGASGAILTVKAMHELERTGGRYGLAAMCIGVGQGIATIVERIED